MNILILSLYAPTKTRYSEGIGGAQEVIYQLGRRWVKMGHNVKIISAYRDKNIPKKEEIDGIEIERVCNFYTAIYGIRKAYKKYENWTDVVLENYTSYPLYTPLYVRKPLFVIMHHLMGKEYIKALGLQGLIGYLSEKLILYIYKRTKFIAVSDFAKKQLLNIGIPEKNINVIYNGIDLDEYKPDEKSRDPLIFFIGNFVDGRKRVEDLIEAFKIVNEKISDAKLIIAGYGGKRENLIKKLINNNSNIEFLGRIDQNKKKELYQKAWIFVNPSIMEGFSLTALEANACGTPVIAYKIDGLKTVISGVNGLVVEKRDIRGLADTMSKLIEEAELREQLSKNAREFAEKYSWDASAKRYLDVFQNRIKKLEVLSNEKTMKILIIGGYGFKNIGDEAILSGLLKTLNDDSTEITVFSYNPSETMRFHNIRAEKKNLRRFIISDEIIIGGGELFQDGMAWKNSLAIILAKLLRKRVRVLGIGIDINNKIEKFLTKLAFKFVDEITVRDKRSFQELIDLGISASKIKLVKDYAFYLTPSVTKKIENFYSSYLLDSKFIVIVLRPKNQEINKKLLSFFIDFVIHLLQNDSNLKIVLLPFSKHPYSIKDNDMVLLKKIKNNIKDRRLILFDEDLKPEEILWLMSKADLVISARLHPLIFAKIVGANAIAIPLFPKIRSFAEGYGYPIIELSKLTELYEIIPKIIGSGR